MPKITTIRDANGNIVSTIETRYSFRSGKAGPGGRSRFVGWVALLVIALWPFSLFHEIGTGAAWTVDVAWLFLLLCPVIITVRQGQMRKLWAESEARDRQLAGAPRPWPPTDLRIVENDRL